MRRTAWLGFALLAAAAMGCTPTLHEEPAAGMLRPGDVVRVQDGSCPPGQVRRITVGPPSADPALPSPRSSACIPL